MVVAFVLPQLTAEVTDGTTLVVLPSSYEQVTETAVATW
jgi:hypothetical protein